ncbi:fimbrial protein [Gemmiger sp.]
MKKRISLSPAAHKGLKATLFVSLCSALTAMPAFATGANNPAATTGTTVWTKASEIMQDVYSQIISISTVTAVVCAAVALLLMNFSKNGKTVDDSRAWLKRIAITWAILNGLGFIMAYVTPFFQGGTWNP